MSDENRPPKHATYIGDGIYAHTQYGSVVISAEREDGWHWICFGRGEASNMHHFCKKVFWTDGLAELGDVASPEWVAAAARRILDNIKK